MITTNLIYLTIPRGIEQVNLSWHVQSTRHSQDGMMIVEVKPEYEYEVVEDNSKAGMEEIVPYKEKK